MDMQMKRPGLINTDIAPLFGKPEAGMTVTDEGLYGMALDLFEKENGYVYCKMDYGYEGWIREEDIVEGTWPGEYKKVRVMKKRQADVMTETSVSSVIMATLTLGGILEEAPEEEQQGIKEGWVKVRLADGRWGYTKKGFLEDYVPFSYTTPPMEEEAFREEIVKMIKLYEGTAYRWGGKSPQGIDCSGLCSMAYLLAGVAIHRDAGIKPEYKIHTIERKDMKKGDLLFFPGHVAMYLGGERELYIHSTAKAGSDGVDYNSLKEGDPLYRKDLAEGITEIGSLYPLQ